MEKHFMKPPNPEEQKKKNEQDAEKNEKDEAKKKDTPPPHGSAENWHHATGEIEGEESEYIEDSW